MHVKTIFGPHQLAVALLIEDLMTDSLVIHLYSGKFQSSNLAERSLWPVACGSSIYQNRETAKKNLSSVILVLFIYYFSMYSYFE